MKLFHTENGKESVYVQIVDILFLANADRPIPSNIFYKSFAGITTVDDTNRFNFVKFDEEYELKFFRKLDFIIDYDQYKNLTDQQLDEKVQKLTTKVNEIKVDEILEKEHTMTANEKIQYSNLLLERENAEYMLKILSIIYDVKHGKKSMPFPEFVEKI